MQTNKIIPLFVYGTLMNARTLDMLNVQPIHINDAKLNGFKKVDLNIVEEEGAVVNGHYFQIDEKEFARLDGYEGYPYLYHRFLVNVEVNGTFKRAYVYQLV